MGFPALNNCFRNLFCIYLWHSFVIFLLFNDLVSPIKDLISFFRSIR